MNQSDFGVNDKTDTEIRVLIPYNKPRDEELYESLKEKLEVQRIKSNGGITNKPLNKIIVIQVLRKIKKRGRRGEVKICLILYENFNE